MPLKQKFNYFIPPLNICPCIYTARHSNLVNYFTFAISVPGLVSVHFSSVIKGVCFVVPLLTM